MLNIITCIIVKDVTSGNSDTRSLTDYVHRCLRMTKYSWGERVNPFTGTFEGRGCSGDGVREKRWRMEAK